MNIKVKNSKLQQDLPREIMLEIEPQCNLDCKFCFNKNSFAEKGRDIDNKLTTPLIKKIINDIVKIGVPIIRFTGGEPLLRDDVWELAEYAKSRNLEVRLNTNGVLINSPAIAKKIVHYFDNILLPIQYSDVLGGSRVARSKKRAIKFLKDADIKVLRLGTVAIRRVINNLDKVPFYK
jgi:MoaA/NifB/PqqE/SkfB family radical SAM enzyme